MFSIIVVGRLLIEKMFLDKEEIICEIGGIRNEHILVSNVQ